MSISKQLKSDLIIRPIEQVFQQHVIDGSSFYFRELLKDINLEYEFRNNLSDALSININDIVIVGSAKLGFSLKTKDFNSFDHLFKSSNKNIDKSDIDVAVINKRFFDKTAHEIYNSTRHFDRGWMKENWRVNRYYNKPKYLFNNYSQYLAKGWLRPDYFPNEYLANQKWINVCDDWYIKTKRRKISVGFYSDWIYFKNYQIDQLSFLKNEILKLEVSTSEQLS